MREKCDQNVFDFWSKCVWSFCLERKREDEIVNAQHVLTIQTLYREHPLVYKWLHKFHDYTFWYTRLQASWYSTVTTEDYKPEYRGH